MKKFFSIIGLIFSIIAFLAIMGWVIPLLPLMLLIIFNDIEAVLISGFSTSGSSADSIWIFAIPIAVSLLIPVFRKMYYKLPWLFPYVKIFYINVVIMGIALMILNYGYKVQNETRHTIFFILMLLEIVIGRILMSIYFNWKRVEHIGGDEYE
ncbi:MAG: hypothetical protein FWH53_00340 [Leptospirales bacterium]|nr:hypothetical protein [Leptospirales bacterium]